MTIGLGEQLAGTLIDTLAIGTVPIPSFTTGGTTTTYGHSFPLARNVTYSWEVKFSSSGVVAVKVELEQSRQRPAIEGTSDVEWYVPDSKVATPIFSSIADTNLHGNPYSPMAGGYGRLKFTGTGSNDAATAVTVARAYAIKNSF